MSWMCGLGHCHAEILSFDTDETEQNRVCGLLGPETEVKVGTLFVVPTINIIKALNTAILSSLFEAKMPLGS